MKTLILTIVIAVLNYSSIYAQNDASRVTSIFVDLVERYNNKIYYKPEYAKNAAHLHATYLLNKALDRPNSTYNDIHELYNPHRQYDSYGNEITDFYSVGRRVIHFLKDENVVWTSEIINYLGYRNCTFTDEELAKWLLESYLSSPPHKEAIINKNHNVIGSYTWIIKRADGFVWVQNVTVFAIEKFNQSTY